MKAFNKLSKISLFFLFEIVFISSGQSQIKYQFECSSINDGSITLKIWNQKRGEKLKIQQAQQSAVKALLYNGIPLSDNCIGQKPILNNSEAVEKFKAIENEFFAKKGIWLTFTRSANPDNIEPQILADERSKAYSLIISNDHLRKYLEEKGIIKPLNSIF